MLLTGIRLVRIGEVQADLRELLDAPSKLAEAPSVAPALNDLLVRRRLAAC